MKIFLRSLALVTLATMGITAVNAGGEYEWREGKGKRAMKEGDNQCSLACKAKCARIKAIIAKFKDPTDRAEFEDVLKHKHCLYHKLEWLDENMCQKCKNNLKKHEARIKADKSTCKNKGKCSSECRAKCERLNKAIDKLEDRADRVELRDVLKHKHCMHRKLEWLEEHNHLCATCKDEFNKHIGHKEHKACIKCEKCKHGHIGEKDERNKHENKRKLEREKRAREERAKHKREKHEREEDFEHEKRQHRNELTHKKNELTHKERELEKSEERKRRELAKHEEEDRAKEREEEENAK